MRARKPDLVLTDVMMPRLDGFGLLRELRADPELRDLPVILLSARAGEEARVEGLDAGADDYLTKPFSARELIARVNANLEMARIRREATRELRESEARFRNMAEHAPVMMWMTDPTGSLTYLNRLLDRIHRADARGGARLRRLGGAASRRSRSGRSASSSTPMPRASRSGSSTGCAAADGAYRWALSAAAPALRRRRRSFSATSARSSTSPTRKEAEQILQQANELLEQRVAAAIAERAQAEAQLRQAQKMEAVGKLTGGVAHDFNNVLQVIGGNLQLLARDVAGNVRAPSSGCRRRIAAISRGSKLASQLLAFGRRQPLAPKVVNLGRLIRGIDDMLRRALGEGVEIETIIAGGLWNTFVDPAQVENALLNLAINARDAMDGHGKLTIEAGNAYLDDDYAARHAEVAAGQYVMLAVTDTGCGMSARDHRPASSSRSSPPSRRARAPASGSAWSMASSSSPAATSRSTASPATARRCASTCRAREQHEDVETDVEAGPATGGTETVLVVEDDEEVRGTVVDMLSDLGYRVLKAKDARERAGDRRKRRADRSAVHRRRDAGPAAQPRTCPQGAASGCPTSPCCSPPATPRTPSSTAAGWTRAIELLSKPYTREALARKIRHVLRNQQQRVGRGAPAQAAGSTERRRWMRRAGARAAGVLVEDDEHDPAGDCWTCCRISATRLRGRGCDGGDALLDRDGLRCHGDRSVAAGGFR